MKEHGFLCDQNGDFSMMRLATGLTVIAPIVILFIQLFKGNPLDWFEAAGMIATALGGKIAQKHYETKDVQSD